MSPELRKALTDWLEWAESGAPNYPDFRKYWGLCSNIDELYGDELYCELSGILEKEFGGELYPFGRDYIDRSKTDTQHECPKRLAWVRKVLEIEA